MRCFFVCVVLTPSLLLGYAGGSTAVLSPVEQRIEAALKNSQSNPKSWQAYNDLATAWCRKGRDDQEVTSFDHAEAVLQHSLQLSPGNYEARKIEVTILLGKHEFAQALTSATELNHRVPDDIGVWGLLVDTNVALGNYAEAEHAAQWILDLRPGSALGFIKAAGLRELFGDAEGALQFFDEAYRRISQNDADERAWLLNQSARFNLAIGNTKKAEELLEQSFKLFPDSQLGLATLATLRMAEGNYEDAALLMGKRYHTVSSVANLYDWAEALEKSGRREESVRAFQEFELKARADVAKTYNSNLQLILYYTDRDKNPSQALAIAARECAVRHDSATLDAYAWALYRNDKYEDAKVQINRALAVGVRSPVFFCHAAQIAKSTGDTTAFAAFAKELQALSTNSCPEVQPASALISTGAVP